jgi:phosphatidate cytidylyltransferase
MTALLSRIITSLILIPIVILAIFYLPPLFFLTLVTMLMVLASFEMSNLFWPKNLFFKLMFLGCLVLVCILSQLVSPFFVLVAGSLWWLFVPYFLTHYSLAGTAYFDKLPFRLMSGFFTFIPCLTAIITLWFDFGPKYLLFILCIVWAADVGAYFAGQFYGRHRLASKISPKKTVEGVIGGIVLSLSIAIVVGIILHLHIIAWVMWLLLILVVVLWSIIGDLFESMLKRIAKVKNSSNLLPGHGGLYDRIDSLTAAIPIFVLGLMLFRL